jgi:aspartyl-tRNA(Asn)/glutamyl-tRNA(Gln) amidotransferase subunit A
MDVAGDPCTFGSLIYKDHIADSTAPLAERMLAAGAIPHLRTRTPEFSCAGFTHSRLWGVSHNPWNAAYDVGGSSGGSAAALASGMTPLAGGSDIGGSIRIPASCCGVVGYKPPYGRVPQHPPFSLDTYCHEGPLARTVADVALFTNIIAGPHPEDITSLPKTVDLPLQGSSIKGRKIAVCHTLGDYPVDPDMLANLDASAEAFRAAGAIVETVELPWTREQIMRASGIHYGAIFGPSVARSVAEHAELMTDYAIHFAKISAEVFESGSFLEGLAIEGYVYAPLGELLLTYDALICPTLAVPALDAGISYVTERVPVAGEEITMWEHMMTVPFNICSRLPVLAVPSGFAASGVPTGIQIVGRAFDDATVFDLGYALERERPWNNKHPNFA